jgi:alpha-galactosidase
LGGDQRAAPGSRLMPVEWRESDRQGHLHDDSFSYIVRVLENGWLGHLHAGAPLASGLSYAHLGPENFEGFANRVGEPVGLELPTPSSGDARPPALVVQHPDGSAVLDLRYVRHRIVDGKPALVGLPSVYVEHPDEAQTLEVTLADTISGLEVDLRLTIFADLPVVSRSVVVRNSGPAALLVRTAMSGILDLPDHGWRLLTLSGTWARERYSVDAPLLPGDRAVASVRGISGHEHNPVLLLRRPDATEATGEVLAMALVYSGNFLAQASVEPRGTTRLRMGINPEGFTWTLDPGAELTLPEVILCWSNEGLGGVSDALHVLLRERLARGVWRDRERPILVNSWEGVYFDFDHDRLVEMARATADLGVELFVLDDGWFGERDSDDSSLGDWVVDRRKLPRGLGALASDIEAQGLRFGIWIEPEMVSPRSRLFSEHPDWAIGVPGRQRTQSRNQFVLDLSRPEVVDHLEQQIVAVLESAAISYVKWDMNRDLTEPYGSLLPPDRQGEFFHRQVLGVYDLWRRLTERFPDILFESCAGGGARFDPGLLAYAPQAWTSDDTDAVERLRIQWGTSLIYPLSSMGAHVSAVPNHQVGRVTPLATRAAVSFFGCLGYELDPRLLTVDERDQIRAHTAFYRERRHLFQRGRFVRLRSPFEGNANETAWMVVSDDRRRAVAAHYRVLARPVPEVERLPLRGLDPALRYRVREAFVQGGEDTVRGADELMSVGLALVPITMKRLDPQKGDFQARIFDLQADV